MTIFENELKNNKFICSQCSKCNKIVWPPSDFCNNCFGNVNWKPVSRKAKLVEFVKKENIIFCIAEFENSIRVMGTLEAKSENLMIGQELDLTKCDYNGKEIFIFRPIEN